MYVYLHVDVCTTGWIQSFLSASYTLYMYMSMTTFAGILNRYLILSYLLILNSIRYNPSTLILNILNRLTRRSCQASLWGKTEFVSWESFDSESRWQEDSEKDRKTTQNNCLKYAYQCLSCDCHSHSQLRLQLVVVVEQSWLFLKTDKFSETAV